MSSVDPSDPKSVLVAVCNDEIKSYASIVCLWIFKFLCIGLVIEGLVWLVQERNLMRNDYS